MACSASALIGHSENARFLHGVTMANGPSPWIWRGETPLPQMESTQSPAGKTIQGEVLRVEGNDCMIKDQDGKEVRLQIDITTLKARNIEPGDRIEARVNNQNQVLSLRPGGHGSPK